MIVATYCLYLLISLVLTVSVARMLHKQGAIFLMDAFRGNAELAESVNHLLIVGFYLVNAGFVFLALGSDLLIDDWRKAIEILSVKLGWVLLTLGALHFFNLFIFSKLRAANELRRDTLQPFQLEGTISDYLR